MHNHYPHTTGDKKKEKKIYLCDHRGAFFLNMGLVWFSAAHLGERSTEEKREEKREENSERERER